MPVIGPFAATVKFVDAALTTPVVGPVRVVAVAAAAVAVYVMAVGLVKLPLFVTLIVFAPVDAGV